MSIWIVSYQDRPRVDVLRGVLIEPRYMEIKSTKASTAIIVIIDSCCGSTGISTKGNHGSLNQLKNVSSKHKRVYAVSSITKLVRCKFIYRVHRKL